MKRVLYLLAVCMLVVFLLPMQAYASACDGGGLGEVIASRSFVTPSNGEHGGITPYGSWTGSGGTARLNVMSGGYLVWSVTPTSDTPYVFRGEITVIDDSSGAFAGAHLASGVAYGGGTVDGQMDFAAYPKIKKGGTYRAYFEGAAYTIDEGLEIYSIIDDAHIYFMYI